MRRWALAHPHEYALIYGSPVPGYAAPQDTVVPAQRLTMSMIGLLVDAEASGEITATTAVASAMTANALELIRSLSGSTVSDGVLQRGVAAWTQLFGHLSFELFGQFHTIVENYDTFFDEQMRLAIEPLTRRN